MLVEKTWKLSFWGGFAWVFGNLSLVNFMAGKVGLGFLYLFLFGFGCILILKKEIYVAFSSKKKSPALVDFIFSFLWLILLIYWLVSYGQFEEIYWAIDFYYWIVSVLYIAILFSVIALILAILRLGYGKG